VGGWAAGVITNDRLGYEGHQVGVAVFASDSIQFDTFIECGLPDRELQVGRALGDKIRQAPNAGNPSLLLLYEVVKNATLQGPELNMGTPFLHGMTQTLGTWPHAVGLGLHGGLRWAPGLQYFDDHLEAQSAIAIMLSGKLNVDTVAFLGLQPMSTYRTITKVDGAAICEIDNRPALEVIESLVGPDLRWQDYPLTVTFGVNKGDKFGDFREDDYGIYLCMAVQRERGALIMSDTYLQPGMEVQLMRRRLDFADQRRRAIALVEQANHRKPFFALYIDCAGRQSVYACTKGEEACEVQSALGETIPLLGLYSGSEISRVGTEMQRLNHAGILSIFSE